jgi:drug/metabolite transporter (DMT)-like permease
MMEELIVWLKTSLLGIIILGALGSMIAATLIYVITKKIPRVLGTRKSHFLSHKQVLDRVFAKRQHNLLLTYFMHHLMYVVTGVLFGAIMAFWAFWFMHDGERFTFSGRGILLLSGAFYSLAVGIYNSYYIQRTYREKFLPLLREADSKEQSGERAEQGGRGIEKTR